MPSFPVYVLKKMPKAASGHFANAKVDSDVNGNEILKVSKRLRVCLYVFECSH